MFGWWGGGLQQGCLCVYMLQKPCGSRSPRQQQAEKGHNCATHMTGSWLPLALTNKPPALAHTSCCLLPAVAVTAAATAAVTLIQHHMYALATADAACHCCHCHCCRACCCHPNTTCAGMHARRNPRATHCQTCMKQETVKKRMRRMTTAQQQTTAAIAAAAVVRSSSSSSAGRPASQLPAAVVAAVVSVLGWVLTPLLVVTVRRCCLH